MKINTTIAGILMTGLFCTMQEPMLAGTPENQSEHTFQEDSKENSEHKKSVAEVKQKLNFAQQWVSKQPLPIKISAGVLGVFCAYCLIRQVFIPGLVGGAAGMMASYVLDTGLTPQNKDTITNYAGKYLPENQVAYAPSVAQGFGEGLSYATLVYMLPYLSPGLGGMALRVGLAAGIVAANNLGVNKAKPVDKKTVQMGTALLTVGGIMGLKHIILG